jgi:hypothetical protein
MDADADPPEGDLIERAVLNDCEEGRRIAATFVKVFGDYVSNEVRPILREFAADGGQPQLLMNGLAELLRSTATSIEFPLDHPRAGAPVSIGEVGDEDEGGDG